MRGSARVLLACGIVLLGAALMATASGRLDTTPPLVQLVDPPDGPRGGHLSLEVQVDDLRPGLGGWAALLDGQPIDTTSVDGRLEIDTTLLPDGEHALLIEAWDRAWSPNLGTARHTRRQKRWLARRQGSRRHARRWHGKGGGSPYKAARVGEASTP